LLASLAPASAQTIGQVFDRVNASVVVIRARGHDAPDTGSGLANFTETGERLPGRERGW
jgi:hypothetical protein